MASTGWDKNCWEKQLQFNLFDADANLAIDQGHWTVMKSAKHNYGYHHVVSKMSCCFTCNL